MYKELCSKLVASMDYNLKAVKNQHLALEILHKRIGALSGYNLKHLACVFHNIDLIRNFLQRCKTCFNLPKEKRNIDLRLKEIESSINEVSIFLVEFKHKRFESNNLHFSH